MVLVAGCGKSTAEAKDAFCSDMKELSSAIVNYEGLLRTSGTTTTDQLDSAYDDVSNAYNNVVNDADGWVNADDNEIAGAYDDLYSAYQNLGSDVTLAQALDTLKPQLEAIPHPR